MNERRCTKEGLNVWPIVRNETKRWIIKYVRCDSLYSNIYFNAFKRVPCAVGPGPIATHAVGMWIVSKVVVSSNLLWIWHNLCETIRKAYQIENQIIGKFCFAFKWHNLVLLEGLKWLKLLLLRSICFQWWHNVSFRFDRFWRTLSSEIIIIWITIYWSTIRCMRSLF